VLTDVGDVPIQEIRDCSVDDHRLMNVISESVKLVMEEVYFPIYDLELKNYILVIMLIILFLSIDSSIM
jgi:hypothetical protein